MKKQIFKITTAMLLLAFFCVSCEEETQIETVSKRSKTVNLSYKTKAAGNKDYNGGASAIIITLKDAEGNTIYNKKQIPLENANSRKGLYNLNIEMGEYILNEFVVVDSDGSALYALPLKGSMMAEKVGLALPMAFTVGVGNLIELSPEVVGSKNKNPEDFGYSTFDFSEKYSSIKFRTGKFGAGSEKIEFNNVEEGELTIDWGDGIKEGLTGIAKHFYKSGGTYHITVEGNIGLIKEIEIWKSDIKSMDITQAVNLEYLEVYSTPIETFDLSKNIKLETLNLMNTWLMKLDVTENIYLRSITCSNSHIRSIDLSRNPSLEYLNLTSSRISYLNLKNNTLLKYISLAANDLTSLDLANNPRLHSVILDNNNLSNLVVSGKEELHSLHIQKNKLTYVDLSENPRLKYIVLNDNKINEPILGLIVNEIHKNTVEGNITGKVNIKGNDKPGISTIEKIEILKNSYNWEVNY